MITKNSFFQEYSEERIHGIRFTFWLCTGLLLVLAFLAATSHRGIYPGDHSRYVNWADAIYFQRGLEGDSSSELYNQKSIASILHASLTALAYHAVGRTLLASHLFPVILTSLTPLLLFLLLRRITGHDLWAFLGTLLYISYPTNFVVLGMPLSEPSLLFCLVVTMLLMDYAQERPWMLPLVGISASFMSLARLFDGFLMACLAGIAIMYQHRKRFPWKWFVGAVVAFFGVHVLTSWLFDYSLIKYYDYSMQMVWRAKTYNGESSEIALSKAAIRLVLKWHLGGVAFAPLLLVLMVLGSWKTIRQNRVYPLLSLLGYGSFMIFLIGGRQVMHFTTRLASKLLPAAVILLVVGIQCVFDALCKQQAPRKPLWVGMGFLTIFLAAFGGISLYTNQQYMREMGEIVPAASLWKIIEHNVPYPLEREKRNIDFREYAIKEVLGSYRPYYLSGKAREKWDSGQVQRERESADWGYDDDFLDGERWRRDVVKQGGSSALWLQEREGHLGAFPFGAEASIVYKFSFPSPAARISLADIHTQWEEGDLMRMWTSLDGQEWILRYDYDLRHTETYFYQEFHGEILGTRDFYVKYYFYAGDARRADDDNRGASLRKFSLAVDYLDDAPEERS